MQPKQSDLIDSQPMSERQSGKWHWDGHIGRFAKLQNGVVVHKWPDQMDRHVSTLESELETLRQERETLRYELTAHDGESTVEALQRERTGWFEEQDKRIAAEAELQEWRDGRRLLPGYVQVGDYAEYQHWKAGQA